MTSSNSPEPSRDQPAVPQVGSPRLASVDAIRGIVMARMLIGIPMIPAVASLPSSTLRDAVNSQLHHAAWHGMTWVDFSFAAYVMLMGLSVALAFGRRLNDPSQRRGMYWKIIRRSIALFALGFLYNGGFSQPWPGIRLAGVLQRMAICYFIGGLLFLHVRPLGRQSLLLAILLGYWAIMALVPVPGGTPGDYSFEGNLAAWIDAQWLPGKAYYGRWDPEGILTTLPAIASCLVGTLWGDLLRSKMRPVDKLMWLGGAGLMAINLGCLWDTVFPINKSLWTSSYVLVTAGIGSLLLAVCFLLADICQRSWLLFPFIVIGRNLLVAFLIIGLIPLQPLVQRLVGGDITTLFGPVAPFLAAITESLVIWLFLYWLYLKGIVLKI